MLSPEWIVILVLSLLGSLMSFIFNIGIVLADSKSWRQGKKFNHSDLIHLIMGVVNIIMQCSLTGQGIIYLFCLPALLHKEVYSFNVILNMTLTYYSYWLSAGLCVHYCISITNLSHRVFVWLKKTFLVSLPHLLFLSMVASFIITIPAVWNFELKIIKQSLGNGSCDSDINASFSFGLAYIQTARFLGCCIPFLLILISIVVTVSSLLKHMWKMKKNDSSFGGSKFGAHINAIRTMILFLALFIVFYIDVNLFYLTDLNFKGPLTIVGWIIFMSFPLVESIIIIQASAKLKKFLFGKFFDES